jgi:hypothetical protein
MAKVTHILRGEERDWLGILWTLVRLIALVPYRLVVMGLGLVVVLLRRKQPPGPDSGGADGNSPEPRAAWLRPLLGAALRRLRPVPGVVFVAVLITMVFMVCPLGWVPLVVELALSGAVLLALWWLRGFWKLCAVLSLGLLLIPLILAEGSPSRAGDLLAEVNAELREMPWPAIGRWLLLTAPTILAGVGVVLSLKGKGGSLRRLTGKIAHGEGGSTRAASLSCAGRVVRCLVAFRSWLRPWLLILAAVVVVAAIGVVALTVPREALGPFVRFTLVLAMSALAWIKALPVLMEIIAVVCLLLRVRRHAGPGGLSDWLRASAGAALATVRRGRLA